METLIGVRKLHSWNCTGYFRRNAGRHYSLVQVQQDTSKDNSATECFRAGSSPASHRHQNKEDEMIGMFLGLIGVIGSIVAIIAESEAGQPFDIWKLTTGIWAFSFMITQMQK